MTALTALTAFENLFAKFVNLSNQLNKTINNSADSSGLAIVPPQQMGRKKKMRMTKKAACKQAHKLYVPAKRNGAHKHKAYCRKTHNKKH